MRSSPAKTGFGPVFWKISGAGAFFQAGSSAVDSATIVASFIYQLTGSVFAVGATSAILRLGWLLPQIVVGFLAQRAGRRMPFYVVGAFGRASALAVIAVLLALAADLPRGWLVFAVLALWTLYAFVSGIVAVPYNDIVGRSIPSEARSRMLALRFFAGGLLALAVAWAVHRLLAESGFLTAHALIFALAAALMFVSSVIFVSAGEPAAVRPSAAAAPGNFADFVRGGWQVLRGDRRFRLFLYVQWLGGAALMALPFYVVAAMGLGLRASDVAFLLGAQTAGSLLSNAAWGRIGDTWGKRALLEAVGVLRLAPPLMALVILLMGGAGGGWTLWAFAVLFVLLGALVNGTTIGYLGYLMEISPNERRPAYSAYFNALASPAALLPLLGAVLAELFSLQAVFAAALAAAVVQFVLIRRLAAADSGRGART
jgi:MFS family permease